MSRRRHTPEQIIRAPTPSISDWSEVKIGGEWSGLTEQTRTGSGCLPC